MENSFFTQNLNAPAGLALVALSRKVVKLPVYSEATSCRDTSELSCHSVIRKRAALKAFGRVQREFIEI